MVGHVLDLAPGERRELLTLLTQERADLQTDDEVLAELSETLRRQLSLGAATDLAEGFRRRMIRIAEELGGEDRSHGHYDFLSDRKIAEEVLMQVHLRAKALSSGAEGDFMADFAKSFRTMSQDRRATWLREAALAASAAEPDEAAARHAAGAAKEKASAEDTAARIATDVASIAHRAVRKKGAARARSTAPAVLGLVAGGAVAFAIRDRRKARDAAVQVRRERQATQAVVTTCAYVLTALDAA
ncbi:MAG TPA: hypothetical protein VFX51_21310 [Solirubrobacteraceae bacterium]|nr:hypothetical protein [Solirubrobacteraceae bacterium]